jgi:unsaturated chondroitin disaccharide hydrolase
VTGLSTLYHLRKAGVQRLAASGESAGPASATDLAAGLVMGGQVDNFTRVSHAHGAALGTALWRFGDQAFDALAGFCKSESVPLLARRRARLITSEAELTEARQAVTELGKAGFKVTLDERTRTGDPALAAAATTRQAGLAGEAADAANSDIGFILLASSGNAYRLASGAADRALVLQGAATLAGRYSPAVGAVRSRDGGGPGHFKVIIDTLMSVQLLYAGAALGGDPAWKTMATTHALTALRNNVRADGSVVQLVDYDPATGAVIGKDNPQAYSLDTTWSRGQAWALDGLADSYVASGDARLLDGARRVAAYTLAHLPADGVPYWDYQDPSIPSAPRDSSAAAISALGLYTLARSDSDAGRRAADAAAADRIVTSLGSPAYLAEGTAFESVLRHATHQYRMGTRDVGTSYGDYYVLRALLERRLLPPSGALLPVAAATASKGRNPGRVVDGRLGTSWSAKGDAVTLRLDLRSPATVHRVSIAWNQGDRQAYRYDVRTSLDGSTWTAGGSAVSSGASTGFETLAILPASARYVQLVLHGSSTGGRSSISEVQIR